MVSYLGSILREWDSASQDKRKLLLKRFCTNLKGKTASDLEDELGHAASLLLARFQANFRLRYSRPECGLVLDAINVFTCAAGGLEFVDDVTDSGSVLTIISMISLAKPTEADKIAGVKVIISIAKAGIKYKVIPITFVISR